MKKMIKMLGVSAILLSMVACGGPSYTIHTKQDKMIALYQIYDGNTQLEKDYKELMKNLEKATKDGDEKAKAELEEWQGIGMAINQYTYKGLEIAPTMMDIDLNKKIEL